MIHLLFFRVKLHCNHQRWQHKVYLFKQLLLEHMHLLKKLLENRIQMQFCTFQVFNFQISQKNRLKLKLDLWIKFPLQEFYESIMQLDQQFTIQHVHQKPQRKIPFHLRTEMQRRCLHREHLLNTKFQLLFL